MGQHFQTYKDSQYICSDGGTITESDMTEVASFEITDGRSTTSSDMKPKK